MTAEGEACVRHVCFAFTPHTAVWIVLSQNTGTLQSLHSLSNLLKAKVSVRTHNSALAELLMDLNEDWWLNCCSGGWIRCRTDQLTSFSPNEKHINIITGFFSRSPATLSDEMLSHEMQ